jgi:hypothetical protein
LIIIAYIDTLYVFFHGDTIVAFMPILRQLWEKNINHYMLPVRAYFVCDN